MPEIANKFSVIVPVLNAKKYLRASLDSILEAVQRYGNAELIVLDNGSDDGSHEILLTEYGSRAQIQQVRGVTVGGLRNIGAGLADGEFLTFIDSDCRIAPDYFEQALRVLQAGADVTGSQCALEDSPHWIEKTWHSLHAQARDGVVKYINSGNLVVKRQAFLKVGGFDDTMISCEDPDLGVRLGRSGFKIVQALAVRAVHPAGDKSIPMFFRKHAWRSMGMFGMFKNGWISKPVLTVLAHLVLCIAAVVNLFATPAPLWQRVVYFAVLINLAPVLTLLYRAVRAKTVSYSPAQAVLLYHVYFLARIYAIWNVMLSWGASPEERNAKAARLHG